VVARRKVWADMAVAALVFAALAALVHVYIWVLESILWTAPRTRAVFGTTEEEAATTKLLALNQGFYNLFLAAVTAAGIVAFAICSTAVGAALILAGTGSMVLAAVVLLVSSPDKARGALIQGTCPAVAVVLLAVYLAH
jgi:putative membrane protein